MYVEQPLRSLQKLFPRSVNIWIHREKTPLTTVNRRFDRIYFSFVLLLLPQLLLTLLLLNESMTKKSLYIIPKIGLRAINPQLKKKFKQSQKKNFILASHNHPMLTESAGKHG